MAAALEMLSELALELRLAAGMCSPAVALATELNTPSPDATCMRHSVPSNLWCALRHRGLYGSVEIRFEFSPVERGHQTLPKLLRTVCVLRAMPHAQPRAVKP